MNLRTIDQHTPADLRPTASELANLRRGLAVQLLHESGTFFWAWVTGKEGNQFQGVAESGIPGKVQRGDRVSFSKAHVHEII